MKPTPSSLFPAPASLWLPMSLALTCVAQPATSQQGPQLPGVAARREVPALPAPARKDIPALQKQSSWAQVTRHAGAEPDRRNRGVYPVGNGRVFCHMGLGERANTMLGITGPTYQTDAVHAPNGKFGSATLDLVAGGSGVALDEQSVRRVSGANFVVTEDKAKSGLALRTLTFAGPNERHLVRIVEVANDGKTAVAGIELVLRSEGGNAKDARLTKLYESGARAASAHFELTGANASGATLRTRVGDLAPGKAWTGVLTISTHTGHVPPAGFECASTDLAAATVAARKTLAWWQAKMRATSTFDTDHVKLRHLIEDWKVMLLTMRCAESGAVTPMVTHRQFSVRDMNGPMLMFLRFNMWDEAKAYLEFVYDAARVLGRIPDVAPLDLPRKKAAAKRIDWNKIAATTEIPSWIILQHFWYLRITQDVTLIQKHWSLLEACLKRQKRSGDFLLAFHGSERYLHGGLNALYPERIGDGSGFVADDPKLGRRPFSFSSGVTFLIAMQAIGEMLDARHRAQNPGAWKTGPPESRPGSNYIQATFEIMEKIEKRYWLENEKMFAPAISPVTNTPQATPVANANLMPLWVGWTFPTGERSKENLESAMQRLWLRDYRIGSTPTVGYATGETQGMLLTALTERDGQSRPKVLEKLLSMAEPAGTWASVYDEDGRPVTDIGGEWATRGDPAASGVNVDALYFALTGIRFACVPNWDNSDIRMKLRLPPGATYVTYKDVKKDGRHLNVFFREVYEKLSKKEIEENEKLEPAKKRDPKASHRRVRFRIQQLSEDPGRGYFDAAINVCGTMFVRYLWKAQPIAEMEFWGSDDEAILPQKKVAGLPTPKPLVKNGDARLLVVTARPATAELMSEKTTIVDTGMPWTLAELRPLLIEPNGKPTHPQVYLDWGHDSSGSATYRTAKFWSGAWRKLLADYTAAGGVIVRPNLASRYEVAHGAEWRAVEANNGRLELDIDGPTRVRTTLVAPKAGELTLLIGASCAIGASLNGKAVLDREGVRHAVPDADAQLVRVNAGDNVLEVELRGKGKIELFSRLATADGLPPK